jgi:hypothetical protein
MRQQPISAVCPSLSEPAVVTLQSQLSSLSTAYTPKTNSHASGRANQAVPDTAQALSGLQNKALESLAREIPGMEASKFKDLDASDYTPEKIADRISQVVATGLANARANGKSEEDVQALYESAVKGVERGFKEAKEILSNLKVLNGSIADQVGATERATFDALGEISPSHQPQASKGVTALAVAERYQQADDFELSLETRDGDRVKVSFSRDLSASSSMAVAADGQGNRAAVLDVSRTESSGFRFSVEGDLSADELEAIQNLVRDVGQVANQFFNGDVQKAFEQAPDIAFDRSQLASMRLHMSRSEQYSVAQRYQQTQQLQNPNQAQSELRLGHLTREMSESAQSPLLAFLDQAKEAVSQLMQGLVEQDSRFKDASSDQQSLYRSNLDRLLGAFETLA